MLIMFPKHFDSISMAKKMRSNEIIFLISHCNNTSRKPCKIYFNHNIKLKKKREKTQNGFTGPSLEYGMQLFFHMAASDGNQKEISILSLEIKPVPQNINCIRLLSYHSYKFIRISGITSQLRYFDHIIYSQKISSQSRLLIVEN